MRAALVCLLCALVAAVVIAEDPLDLKATPRVVAIGISEDLTIDCRPPDSLDDVMFAFLVLVDHEDVNGTITHIAQQSTLTKLLVEDNRTSAKGHTQEEGSDAPSHLTVTIQEPMEEDEGIYTCKFVYLSTEYEVNSMVASINVSVQEVPMAEPYIVPPVLQPVVAAAPGCDCNKIDEIWDEINILKETLLVDNTALKTQFASLDDSCKVSFSARIGQERGYLFKTEEPIVFDAIISNRGGAYSASTGEFEAPCAGQYSFALAVRSFQNMDSGVVEAIIQRDGKPEARTAVFNDFNTDHYESASTSVVLTLAKGDKVNVILHTTSNMGEILGDEYTIFSGMFVSP